MQRWYGSGGLLEPSERERGTHSLVFLAAVTLSSLAAAALVCVAIVGGREGSPDLLLADGAAAAASTGMQADIHTYPDWLKTLTRKPEWNSDTTQQRHLANSAVPFSKRIGSLQGVDFANDAYQPDLSGGASSPWEDIPDKLAKFKKIVDREEVVYNKLRTILDAHKKPDPQSLVVHVAERGPEGPKGRRGFRGVNGEVGPQGPVGAPGPPGDLGARGTRGVIGPTGLKGFPGSAGKRGFEGRIGKRGQQGKPGLKGKTGRVGMPGDVGPPGPQGPNGDVGQKGSRGNQGPHGPNGRGITKWLIGHLQARQ